MRPRAHRLNVAVLLVLAAVAVSGCGRPTSTARPTAAVRPTPVAAVGTPTPDATSAPIPPAEETTVTFAVIGDYGMDDAHERAVARLVASWRPDFIVTTGDGYYRAAGSRGTARYDESTGAYYGKWLKDIRTTGRRHPKGTAPVNAFFPALGNHDYSDATPSLETFLRYFRLPGHGLVNSSGNERYYDFVRGPVHFFVLNSNPQEPSGTSRTSKQARWLKTQLARSTSPWNVVYDHHPPYSSDAVHGSSEYMRWPFAEWGADAVLSGHSHTYERVNRGGIVYFVNGLGGARRYTFGRPVKGSAKRYRANWGAQRVIATDATLEFTFFSVGGRMVDRHRLTR